LCEYPTIITFSLLHNTPTHSHTHSYTPEERKTMQALKDLVFLNETLKKQEKQFKEVCVCMCVYVCECVCVCVSVRVCVLFF
jgi:hypothetical protein